MATWGSEGKLATMTAGAHGFRSGALTPPFLFLFSRQASRPHASIFFFPSRTRWRKKKLIRSSSKFILRLFLLPWLNRPLARPRHSGAFKPPGVFFFWLFWLISFSLTLTLDREALPLQVLFFFLSPSRSATLTAQEVVGQASNRKWWSVFSFCFPLFFFFFSFQLKSRPLTARRIEPQNKANVGSRFSFCFFPLGLLLMPPLLIPKAAILSALRGCRKRGAFCAYDFPCARVIGNCNKSAALKASNCILECLWRGAWGWGCRGGWGALGEAQRVGAWLRA